MIFQLDICDSPLVSNYTMCMLVAQASTLTVYRRPHHLDEFVLGRRIVYIDGNYTEVLVGALVCFLLHSHIISIGIRLQTKVSQSFAVPLIKLPPINSHPYRFVL